MNIEQSIYYDESEQKIIDLQNYKNEAIKNLKKDLETLQIFIQKNQFINSGKELYILAKEILEKSQFKFNTENYLIDENFLYTFDNKNLFIHYLLALFNDDCSLEQYIMYPNDSFLYNDNNELITKEKIDQLIKNCGEKKYIFVLLSLRYTYGEGHETSLFIDTEKKTIEYFDPNYIKGKYTYTEDDKKRIEDMIEYYFVLPLEYTHMKLNNESNNDICINLNFKDIAFQALDIYDRNESDKNIEKEGYCVNWTFFYLYCRLKSPNQSQEVVIKNFYQILKGKIKKNTERDKNDIGFISIIRSINLFQKLFLIIFEHYYNIYPINEKDFSKQASEIFTTNFFLDNQTDVN